MLKRSFSALDNNPYSEQSPFFGRRKRAGCAMTMCLTFMVVGAAVCVVLLSLLIAKKEQVSAQLMLDIGSIDGDFAFWDPNNQVLYWVDRHLHTVNYYSPTYNTSTTRQFNHTLGVVVPRLKYNDSVVVTAGQYVYSVNLTSGEEQLIASLCYNTTKGDYMQFSDGRCDPSGALWTGAADIEGEPVGTLFRIQPNQTVTDILQNISVPGGMAWSKDKKTFYFIDSQNSLVNAYAYNPDSGAITFQNVAYTMPASFGVMSGMTIDTSDSLWISVIAPPEINGTGKVCRCDPVRGQLQQTITLPVSSVTSCVFGGPNLDELYITTRHKPGELHSGGIFVAKKLGVSGAYPSLFAG